LENLEERGCFEGLSEDGSVKLYCIFKKKGWDGLKWNNLAQDGDKY
jgi:hypothetical protein